MKIRRGPLHLLLCFLGGCASPSTLFPPVPEEIVQVGIDVPPSRLDMAVTIGLEQIKAEGEKALPLTEDATPYTSQMDGGADQRGGVDLGYHIERSPLSLRMEDGALLADLTLGYWIKAEYRPLTPLAPRIKIGCGTDGEPLRKAAVTFSTRVDVDPKWTTAVKTTVSVRAENRCLVTLFKKDLTAKVIGALEGKLNNLAGQLDANISQAIHLRDRVTQLWDLMKEPIAVDDGVWLSIHPEWVSISPFELEGDVLSFHIRLVARPAVTGGIKPAPDGRPLPDLRKSVPGEPGFHVLVPVEMSYQEAEEPLAQALKITEGKLRYPASGSPFITVRRIDLSSSGAQALIRLDFDGSAKGCAYLVGTPTYQSQTHILSFTDVDFSVETKNLVLKTLDWLDHEGLRSTLEQALIIDLSKPLAKIERTLSGLLNKKGGVFELSGEFREFRLFGFYVDPLRGTFKTLLLATGGLRAKVP